eukprot:1159851-Pelagomonas_calceolata.AAC.6
MQSYIRDAAAAATHPALAQLHRSCRSHLFRGTPNRLPGGTFKCMLVVPMQRSTRAAVIPCSKRAMTRLLTGTPYQGCASRQGRGGGQGYSFVQPKVGKCCAQNCKQNLDAFLLHEASSKDRVG